MPTPKERLTPLLELAARGEAGRPQLAHKICDLLLDWPSEYPQSARLPFEALLEKAVREIGRKTRGELAARFAGRSEAPIELLNELFFDAPAEMKHEIVARNAGETRAAAVLRSTIDDAALIGSMRHRAAEFPRIFARALALPTAMAGEVLSDASVQSLAIACKGAGLERATFSTIAILGDRVRAAEDSYLRLAVFDAIPQVAAERLLAFWRSKPETELQRLDQAAE